ncbi:UDP-N-acetylglucosamine diphosphorylase [Pichia kluyveri]|uniref:UDP-N-acetylglucosamine diphosphorylase n=1 Tax=Pichia kluyveri TaxID=36015 RepID=A0AAV5QY56_PICKL|nr:UDP-N-acetylglucosamine diphosphorylase [Pichia kluyveri]
MSSVIREKYEKAGQSHIFKYWEQLDQTQQNNFINQLSKINDPQSFINDVSNAIEYSSNISSAKEYTQLPETSFNSTITSSTEQLLEWESKGLELIKNGKVGIILMAGGQGTRLGSTSPKGCYDVGLPSHKSLFQIQVERMRKLELLANRDENNHNVLTLYIMTSGPTRKNTEDFFKENNYFGWNENQIVFFNQGTLPAVDLEGKKLLLAEDKCSLVESPDGNGGLYKALYDNSILEDFKSRGIEHIHMYCIDNILVKVGDPLFIGYSAINNFDVATKVVRKNEPSEKVGLIVLDKTNNVPCVIEYSEISNELAESNDSNDPKLLKLRAANIVNHYYKVEFLEKMVPEWINSRNYLPYHIAKKKISCIDTTTNKFIQPTEPNGIKMEQFIFDVFPSVLLNKFGCLEVAREDEFSPLKNAPGSPSDSPEMCRMNCLKRSTKWIIANGGEVKEGALIEVSPLTSYSGEGLHDVKGKVFEDGSIV